MRALWCLPLLSCVTLVPPSERFVSPPRRLALASPEPRRLVHVDGVSLAVHDSAPGSPKPVLLCLHAIGHGGSDFVPVLEGLEADVRVITLDWPGHGASSGDPTPASAERYRVLLEGLVEALQLERFALLGNSIGGAVAISYAARHPERVSGLILCNPGGLDPQGFVASLFIGHLVSKFHDGAEGRSSFPAWFERYYGDILVTAHAAPQRARIVAAAWESAPVLEQAWRSFATREADLRAEAATLAMPVLIAWARRDGLIQWGRNEPAVLAIPRVTVVEFDAGHSAFLEQPVEFLVAARPFLEALR